MIPNIFHFIFGLKEDFGGKPFNLIHYLSIQSALEINKPDSIFFYYKYLPTGEWFDKIKDKIKLIEVNPPQEIFGNKLFHVAHQADVLRLQYLYKYGGIYMDLDTICVKPFTELLDKECVMGRQLAPDGKNIQGVCNAVILSQPQSEFIRLWYNTYKYFRSTPINGYSAAGGGDNYYHWDEHSVYIPKQLSSTHPDKIHIENYKSFHYPIWDTKGIEMMFKENHNFDEAYCHHLWESAAWEYMEKLTVDDIKNVDTTYNKIVRRFL